MQLDDLLIYAEELEQRIIREAPAELPAIRQEIREYRQELYLLKE